MKRQLCHLLLISAAIFAGWMAVVTWIGSRPPGCGPGGTCNDVLSSKWSTLFGMPVAALGSGLYLMLVMFSLRDDSAGSRRRLPLRAAASLVIASAIYFTAIQAFVIGGFCGFCLAIHAAASLAALGLLTAHSSGRAGISASSADSSGPRSPELSKMPASRLAGLTPAALALIPIAILAFAQAAGIGHRAHRVLELNRVTASATPARMLVKPYLAHDGRVGVAVAGADAYLSGYQVPRMSYGGDHTSARLQVAVLTDWTCNQCRDLHANLKALYADAGLPGIELYLLPVFFDDHGEEIHRAMLQLHFASSIPEVFPTLLDEWTRGELALRESDIVRRIAELEPRLAERWEASKPGFAEAIDGAFAYAKTQMAWNSRWLRVSTLPQLTAFDAVLTGVPSTDDLLGYLSAAAERQQAYLASPEGSVVIDTRVGCSCCPDAIQHLDKLAELISNGGLDNGLVAAGPDDAADADPIIDIPGDGPVLAFTSTSVTTQPIAIGEIATATFELRNTGNQMLEIDRFLTGCGCTTIVDWPRSLAPGATGAFIIQYDSTGRAGYGTDHHRRLIWVASNSIQHDDPTYGHKLEMIIPITSTVEPARTASLSP